MFMSSNPSRVFLDVGAHFGESIFKALNPRLHFDLIVAFEPSNVGCERLKRIKPKNVQIEQYGLGASDIELTLFGAGYLGGSIFSEKINLYKAEITEKIQIYDAATVLRPYLEKFDECFLKLNCEGSEIAIIKSLANNGLLSKFKSIYIDWDARKIPSLKKEITLSKKLLNQASSRYVNADSFHVTGWKGVQIWLSRYENVQSKRITTFRYSTFGFLPLNLRIKEIIKQVVLR